FVEKNYENWINNDEEAPLFSHKLFVRRVVPELRGADNVLLIVVDNLRYDQWKPFENIVNSHYKTEKEDYYYSILPTATQYARRAIFSGLTALQMEKQLTHCWKKDTGDGGTCLFDAEFLEDQLRRLRLNIKFADHKITNLKDGKKLSENFRTMKDNKLIALVYNFVDMISHAKTEMEVIKELASTDKAYRSLTQSWFKNSPLFEIIQQAQLAGFKLIITTDHGTINCKNPSQVIGDKNTSLNLRYKTG